MDLTSSLLAKRLDLVVDSVVEDRIDRLKFMSESVAVVIRHEALLAEVKVDAVLASDKGRSWELCLFVRWFAMGDNIRTHLRCNCCRCVCRDRERRVSPSEAPPA